MNIKKASLAAQEFEDTVLDRSLNSSIPTGLKVFDDILGGLHPGELILIAARGSVGKTALALNLATNVAKTGTPALVFSLEHSAVTVVKKLFTQAGLIMTESAEGKSPGLEVEKKLDSIAALPLLIDDTPSPSLGDVAEAIHRSAQDYGVKAVFIDYLGLINNLDNTEMYGALGTLKALAGDLGLSIVVFHYLDKGLFLGKGPQPVINYIFDSGISYEVLSECVAVAMVLSRPDTFGQGNGDNRSELTVVHNRHGRRGVSMELMFDSGLYSFRDIDVTPEEDE